MYTKQVASETLFQSEANGGSVPATTTYAYTYQNNSFQVSQRVTTLPVVPTSQNGSGTANSRTEVYDSYERMTWSKDERGFITHASYDAVTGAMTQRIQDVQTSGMSGVPAGWSTPAGGGLHLITDYESDLLGRTTQELGPTHTIDLNGTATAIRRASWTVYRDDIYQTWRGQGYATGSAGSYAYELVNPVSLAQRDKADRVTDQRQAVRASTSGKLSASDVFPQSSWSRWTHIEYDKANQQTAQRVYFLIPASGAGMLNVNYNESQYGYSTEGRQNKQVTPGGTITRTVFHPMGWTAQSWIGTNDAGATDSDPSGGGASGNNMMQVSGYQYEGGAAGGGGNLTQQTLFQDATTTRVTAYGYDYRNRRISMTPPVGATSAYTFDNRDRMIQTDRHDPGSGALVDVSDDTIVQQAETVYDAASNAVAQTTRERNHNATGTGELKADSNAQPQARVSYQAMHPDPLGRTISEAWRTNPRRSA